MKATRHFREAAQVRAITDSIAISREVMRI